MPRPPASSGRPVVFVGNAIEVTAPIDEQRTYIVRFVTELSWRGQMPDTVSLLVTEAPCAIFFPGLRYVVAAVPDSAHPTRARTPFPGATYDAVLVGRCGPRIAWEDSCATGIMLSALAPAP